jgi:DNA primase
MLSARNKIVVINVLDGVLGPGHSLKGNERAHHCPFCHHHKQKLQVNTETQQWHCWVCNSKGRTIQSLLRRLHCEPSAIQKIRSIYGEDDGASYSPTEEVAKLALPEEFRQLYIKPKSINPVYNKAISYLKKRGIGMGEIVKYNIGYCESGLYSGRIIIPSYDGDGVLNYFIARSFYDDVGMKYKNPPVNRNVIIFENQINWNEPIVLVEGAFDSFSVRRNAIPILGKFIPKKLMEKIMLSGVKEIAIILDSDAVSESVKYSHYFQKNGIQVRNIIPKGKDIGEMGLSETLKMLKSSPESGWGDLVKMKLNNLR